MKYVIPFFLIVLTITSCNNNGKNIEKDSATKTAIVQASMDNNAKQLLSDSTVTSVSIGLLIDGKAYTSHYGELDAGKGNPPNDETIYEIASVTKTMTGILVAQAVLDGELNLEDDIRKYLKDDYPNFQFKNEAIKIKHLVSHTSRLPNNIEGLNDIKKKGGDNMMQEIDKLEKNYNKEKFFEQMKNAVLDTIPGVLYEYNNLAPNLMAHILENVYQKSFDELLNDFIFEKNGMTSTKLTLSEEEQIRFANGYNGKGKMMPHFHIPLWGAAAKMKSTTSDLIKYMRLQLDSTNSTIIESHKITYFYDPNSSIGYYWPIQNNSEGIYYSHHGGAFGTQNYLFIFPEYNMGVSVITNSSTEATGQLLGKTVMGLVDDLKPTGKKSIERAITAKTMENVDEGITLYHQLKKEHNGTYNFENEGELNNLGYALLAKGKVVEAIKIFSLLVSEFPESSNVFDSLGEAYFLNKEYKLALKNYKTSLKLNPNNTNANEMINKIGNLIQ